MTLWERFIQDPETWWGKAVRWTIIAVLMVLLVMVATGCSYIDKVMSRQGGPDNHIYLSQGDRVEFNAISRRTDWGAPIDRYRCLVPPMLCERFASTIECRCP